MNSPRSAAGPLPRRAAFTLVELLVTTVVALLLIVFLFQLFNATMRAWQRGETQNETYREARAAMQMIVRDLSQTTAPMAGSAYPSPASSPAASPTPTLIQYIAPVLVLDRYLNPDPPPQSGDEINEEVYCLTNVPNSGVSNLCAVGYFCAWMPDLILDSDPQAAQRRARAPHAYALMRQFLGSGSATGASASIPTGLFERFKAAGTVVPLSFASIYERVRPPQIADPAAQPPKATATQIASYIWDLQIRQPATETFPSTAYSAQPTGSPATYAKVSPPYLEVRFKALSEDAARQLQGNTGIRREDWNSTYATTSNSVYSRLIQPGMRQFSARVPIYSGSATTTPSP